MKIGYVNTSIIASFVWGMRQRYISVMKSRFQNCKKFILNAGQMHKFFDLKLFDDHKILFNKT